MLGAAAGLTTAAWHSPSALVMINDDRILSHDPKTTSTFRSLIVVIRRIDGTGENGDNRETALVLSLFPPSTLFSPFAK
jgi:hypothetical protein